MCTPSLTKSQNDDQTVVPHFGTSQIIQKGRLSAAGNEIRQRSVRNTVDYVPKALVLIATVSSDDQDK